MKKVLYAFVMVVLLAMCALAQEVRYNFDKEKDFSQYKTYTWVTLKNSEPVSDLADKQIRAAIDAELVTKGLTKVDSNKADLYIGYQAAISKEKEFTSYSSGWGYGPGWYGSGWYGAGGAGTVTTGQTSTIYTGQLALDFYDVPKESLVWRGVVSKTLDPKANAEKQEKNLKKAIAKLLKNYPPAKK